MATIGDSRPLPELIGGLANDISTLFRKEIELVKTEASEKLSQTTNALVLLGGGAVLALGALGVILAAIVTALAAFFVDRGMGATAANSLAAAIVGIIVAIVAWLLISRGLDGLKGEQFEVGPDRQFAAARCIGREGETVMADNSEQKTSAQLEREVEQQRARVENRISDIQDKLSPGQMVDELFNYAKNNGGGDFVANLGKNVSGNPLPVALIGISLLWLMAKPAGAAQVAAPPSRVWDDRPEPARVSRDPPMAMPRSPVACGGCGWKIPRKAATANSPTISARSFAP